MITSTGNAHVRTLVQLKRKAKVRRKEGCFAAEGLRLYQEIPDELIRTVYVSETFEKEHASQLAGKKYMTVRDDVFAYLSDTKTPQGILCVVNMPSCAPERIFRPDGLWIVLETLQDPGNLGTIFRTAEGAGVTGILMDRTTVDVFSPKVVRSTMGSIFRVPFLITDDLRKSVEQLKKCGAMICAADLTADLCYDEVDYREGTAFLIGNEGNGLSPQACAMADKEIRIPMEGKLESLNASVAAALLMYEAARQRRH